MGTTSKQNRENAGSDFGNISNSGFSFQLGLPAAGLTFQLHHVRFAGNADFILHGMRSSCSRRPSSFQRERLSLSEDAAGDGVALWFACQMAAAMAAASRASFEWASSSTGDTEEAARGRRRNSGSWRIRRNNPAFVRIPVIVYSSSARRSRAIVSSLLLPQATSLLSSGS